MELSYCSSDVDLRFSFGIEGFEAYLMTGQRFMRH